MSAETSDLGKFVEHFTRDLAYKAPEQWPGLLETFLSDLLARFDKPTEGTEWGAKWSDGGYCPATPRRSEEFARKHRANFHMKRADLAEQEDACETCDGTGCDFHGGSADPDSPDHYAPCIDRCGDCYGTGSKSYREGWDEALRAHASAARAATPAETTEH